MKRLAIWLLSLFAFCNLAQAQTTQAISDPMAMLPADYELIWSDEFSKDGLPDEAHWSFDTHANKQGWYNQEKQYYADRRLENARVRNGVLEITARREKLKNKPDYGGQSYTSARLISQGKREFQYGFFDIRAKMPCGKGTWPAIWTLGASGNWPSQGEIDILEHMGRLPITAQSAVHTSHKHGGRAPVQTISVPTACTAYHHYQLLWTKDRLIFFVDGVPYHTYENDGGGTASWPFDKPQFLLLNLAMGGVLGGEIDNKALPRTFLVDHVRVYQARQKD